MIGIPVRRPSQSQPHPHGRRLGRPPAAQGLPDRRRAGPLLGEELMAIAPDGRGSTRARASPRRSRRSWTSPDRARPRGHAQGQLRAEPSVHARRAAAHRRPARRGRRRARGGRRLPAHGLREEHGGEDVVEGDHLRPADRLPLLPEQRARLRARDREAARDRGPRRGDLDAHAASPS